MLQDLFHESIYINYGLSETFTAKRRLLIRTCRLLSLGLDWAVCQAIFIYLFNLGPTAAVDIFG